MLSRAGKTVVPLLAVLTVLAVGVAAAAIYLQMQEREKRQAKERELQLAVTEVDNLKVQLDETQRSKSRAEEELADLKKEFSRTQDELVKTIKAQETLTRNIEDREQEIARLTKDLDQTKGESKQMSGQLSALQGERDAVKKRLADLERAKQDLESKVMELSDRPTVELDKVLVTNDPAGGLQAGGVGMADLGSSSAVSSLGSSAESPGSLVMPVSTGAASTSAGQVVVINREYDFVVVNLGKNHGLSVGQEFQIVRGNEVLGRAKVEKVYDELSAAALLPDSKKSSIREGDTVRAM